MDQTEARKLAVELMQETPDRIWVAVTAAHWRGEFESGEPRWGVSNGSRFYDADPRSSVPLSPHDQDPAAYRAGEVHEVAPGQTGGIHDHEDATGQRHRHSHAGWDTPHRHPRDDVHEFEPSEFTIERRGTRPACAVCGNAERATIHR